MMLYRCSGRGEEAFLLLHPVAQGHLSGRYFPASGRKGNKADRGCSFADYYPSLASYEHDTHATATTIHDTKEYKTRTKIITTLPRPPRSARCSRFMRPHRPSTNEPSTNQHTLPPSPTSSPRSKLTQEESELNHVSCSKRFRIRIWLYERCARRACA